MKYKFTKEHRANIAKAKTGTKHSEKTKRKMSVDRSGKKNARYGQEVTKETRRKIGLGNKGKIISQEQRIKLREALSGEKSVHWKGGVTKLAKQVRCCFAYRQWRSDVFHRDDFICLFCGKRGGDLEADHYPKAFSVILKESLIKSSEDALRCAELWDINNGRTLCKQCHRKTDTFGPKKLSTYKQLNENK